MSFVLRMRTKSVRRPVRVRASSSAHTLLCPKHGLLICFLHLSPQTHHTPPQGPLPPVLCTRSFMYPWGERREQHTDTAEFTGLCMPVTALKQCKVLAHDAPLHATTLSVRWSEGTRRTKPQLQQRSFGGKVPQVRLVDVPNDELCQQMIQRPRQHQPAETHRAAGWLGHAQALHRVSPWWSLCSGYRTIS